jgi:hypothetical protein
MKIVSIKVDQAADRYRFIDVRVSFPAGEELTADDIAALDDVLQEVADRLNSGAEEPEPEPEPESKPAARGRGRPRKEPEPEPEPEPARRRRPSSEPAGISDADLVKACSDAAEKRADMVKLIPVILKDDFGVTNTAELAQDVRQKFLDAVAYELEP